MSLIAYEIPDSLKSEIDELESLISSFRNGSISETELKARRVPFGIYEQRKKGTYMIRIRCTAGIITPLQLKCVAELSFRFGSGTLHITTRQEIQIHDVEIDAFIPIIHSLADVGLSTRGGGGNTVRNITAPWDSGISVDEPFDVSPYAVALTSELIAKSNSWLLPRKYKIAFSSSDTDKSFASVQDLGFVAQVRDGIKGFRVFVAGGMGRLSKVGNLLHEFIPADQVFIVAESIKRLFLRYGNRKNKMSARLRFLWKDLGSEQFLKLYENEKDCLLNEGITSLKISQIENKCLLNRDLQPIIEKSDSFEIWKRRYVGEQKQNGCNTATIPLLFGIINAEHIRELADFLLNFGENTIRFTHNQNIALRNIPRAYLGNVYRVTRRISELSDSSPLFGNAVACAGASTCQLGICRSRGALDAIINRLKSSSIDIDRLKDLRIHISGCSNTCGQHMIADLGFYGKAGRKDQRNYPVYVIVAGAEVDTLGHTKLAEKVGEINAHDLPVLVEELLIDYSTKMNHYFSFRNYLDIEGINTIHRIIEQHREIPSFEKDRRWYRDWGDTETFSLAGKGTGECSAGLFDLIELDLARLREIRSSLIKTGKINSAPQELYNLSLVSARMLLITRGVEAISEKDVFNKFEEFFIKNNFVETRFLSIIEKAHAGSTGLSNQSYDDIIALSNAVEKLYLNMDNSLQFKIGVEEKKLLLSANVTGNEPNADLKTDLRGVACPMNFVKTKMALSQLSKGQFLEVTLDDGEPMDNVPKSVAEEGHLVVSTERIMNYWKVLIQKL